MKVSEKIDFCFLKETEHLKHLDVEAIRSSKLRPSEMHIKIKEGQFTILRQHEEQDPLRNNFLISLFSNRDFFLSNGLDLQNVNCEFIFNSNDDVDFYEEGVPRWCFTRRAHHPNLLIPNPHIVNIHKITESFPSTDMEFNEKEDKAIFAGSYTGGYLPEDNQRFYFCMKNRYNELGKFVINNFCVDKKVLEGHDWKSIESDFIPHPIQLKYKYIFNINGNTNCWDRLLWAMNSNSLCLFLRPKREDMCWHYHFFKTFGGFVYVDETDWEASVKYFNENPSVAEALSINQREQSSGLVSIEAQISYCCKILKFYNNLYEEKN